MELTMRDLEPFSDNQVATANVWIFSLMEDPHRREAMPLRTLELGFIIAWKSMNNMTLEVPEEYFVKKLGMSRSTVSKIFRSLEAEGYLVKTKNPRRRIGLPSQYRLTIPSRLMQLGEPS